MIRSTSIKLGSSLRRWLFCKAIFGISNGMMFYSDQQAYRKKEKDTYFERISKITNLLSNPNMTAMEKIEL